jgi:hypothetical protein
LRGAGGGRLLSNRHKLLSGFRKAAQLREHGRQFLEVAAGPAGAGAGAGAAPGPRWGLAQPVPVAQVHLHIADPQWAPPAPGLGVLHGKPPACISKPHPLGPAHRSHLTFLRRVRGQVLFCDICCIAHILFVRHGFPRTSCCDACLELCRMPWRVVPIHCVAWGWKGG